MHSQMSMQYLSLMASTTITVRNFISEVPEDFMCLVSIQRNDKYLTHFKYWEATAYFGLSQGGGSQHCYVQEGKIYFNGSYSRWWVIKQLEIIWDYFFPKKYEMEYIWKK